MIYRLLRAVKLQECAARGLVEVEVKAGNAWKAVGGAEFFVAEPRSEAEAEKEAFEAGSIGEAKLDLLSDFVAGMPAGELRKQAFVSEKAREGRLPYPRNPAHGARGCGGKFCADAEDGAAMGEFAGWSVEESVALENGERRTGAEMLQFPEERGHVCNAELDLDLAI